MQGACRVTLAPVTDDPIAAPEIHYSPSACATRVRKVREVTEKVFPSVTPKALSSLGAEDLSIRMSHWIAARSMSDPDRYAIAELNPP